MIITLRHAPKATPRPPQLQQQAPGPGFSAKDFRTWSATMLAAVGPTAEGSPRRPARPTPRPR
jgi:hypothetical protein